MKSLACTLALLAIFLALPVVAQTTPATPPDAPSFVAAGVTYNNGSADAPIAGTVLYAKKLADSGTYAFTILDAVPASSVTSDGKRVYSFSTVTTNIGVGLGQKVLTVGKFPVYGIISASLSWTGQNTGWAYSGGGMVPIRVNDKFSIAPTLRFSKSSVNGAVGYQLLPGVLFLFPQQQ